MLMLFRLPCTLEPTQTANSGAPVHRLIEQRAEAVISPIFFSAMRRLHYLRCSSFAPGENGRQPRQGEGSEAGLTATTRIRRGDAAGFKPPLGGGQQGGSARGAPALVALLSPRP